MAKELEAMTDQELEALYVEVANEKHRRETREATYKELVESISTILPFLEAYAKAYNLDEKGLAAGFCKALAEVRSSSVENARTVSVEKNFPEWKQPSNGNAYNSGDIVTFQGKIWKSTQNNNAWPPGTYPQGWEEVGA